jgi:hypothetical protein
MYPSFASGPLTESTRGQKLSVSLTIVLCDLIASWLVLIEIMLPIKRTFPLNDTIQGMTSTDCWHQNLLL